MANNEKKQTARDKIQIIYPIVVDVYKGRRTLNDGADYLVEEMGMNQTTAKFYIAFFLHLKKGTVDESTRGPTNVLTYCFFEKILADDGKEGLKIALKSLWECIEYTERVRDYTMVGFRAIHEEFSAKLK